MSATSDVVVETCDSPRAFVAAQRAFYRDDPHFVPPVEFLERRKVDLRRHPFFEHAEGALWLARRNGAVVGRISATRDRLHDEYHGDRIGFFGHFEARDEAAAHALLHRAEQWLVEHGATTMRGPIDFSTNYRCGLLIEGDPGTPFLMMPHHPLAYRGWLESFGLNAAKDLLALHMTTPTLDLRRLDRICGKVLERTPLQGRMLDLRRFDAEIELLWSLYNRIWERNWGFVPMSRAEFFAEAKDMKSILRKELTLVMERDGEPVAFALGLPDVNLAIHACGGRLLPLGWWTFLSAMRRVRRFRVITLGVLPGLRGSGIDAVMLRQLIAQGDAAGFDECEASWILEDNAGMLRPLLTTGARVYRRYRVFAREIGARTGADQAPVVPSA